MIKGVPQGSILGPLLFCLFINDLPLHISNQEVSCELFADDGTLHTPDMDIDNINFRLQQSVMEVEHWCKNNAMLLNPDKTECMVLATRQKHQLGLSPLNLLIDGRKINQVQEHRLLGLIVDNQFQWEAHVTYLCKIISRNLFLLKRLKYLTDSNTRKIFFNAHIRSHIDYASTVWDDCSDVRLKRLDSLYRRAAKLVLPDPHLTTAEKMKQLEILPLSTHLHFNKGTLMYKVLNNKLPMYLSTLFTKSVLNDVRSTTRLLLPRPRIDTYKTSLSFSGALLWNSLPANVRAAGTLTSFKDNLFRYLVLSSAIT